MLGSPSQTCFDMSKPRKMDKKLQVLGVKGFSHGLTELANHGAFFPSSKPLRKMVLDLSGHAHYFLSHLSTWT